MNCPHCNSPTYPLINYGEMIVKAMCPECEESFLTQEAAPHVQIEPHHNID